MVGREHARLYPALRGRHARRRRRKLRRLADRARRGRHVRRQIQILFQT